MKGNRKRDSVREECESLVFVHVQTVPTTITFSNTSIFMCVHVQQRSIHNTLMTVKNTNMSKESNNHALLLSNTDSICPCHELFQQALATCIRSCLFVCLCAS